MSIALSGVAQAMALPEWRDRWADRRAMIRSVVATVLERGAGELEPVLEEVKRALAYHSLGDRDRAIVRTTFKDVRTIVRGWSTLSPDDQEAFREGRIAPSTVAAKLRK